ncbi:carbohydrate ABC transporter permease [Streptosporangium carneum]|uniref:Sugar ABC transporter permease n=1 Tax=Streptosporangium carneum TaxID=47481 RepID=A0A9W6HY71_9ACTN|nr:carbohydrate ABC transporter permease [Streptosporangium carneum]GLK08491.1 sugar ABC transporter permease [Streptosporangium carneum]
MTTATHDRVSPQAAAVGPRRSRSARAGSSGPTIVVAQAFLVLWAVVSTVPLLWAVISSFKSDPEIVADPWSLPKALRWENFARAWDAASIGTYFGNTVLVVGGGVALTLLLSAMAAYVFARFDFRLKGALYYFFVAGMTFPVFMALVPLFFVVQNLGLGNSLPGLVLVYTAYSLPFSMFFLVAFFRTLPGEIAEAATLDGCGEVAIFFKIMLPMARPGLISVGIFNFIGQWNQYLIPLVLVSDDSKFVLSQGLANLAVEQGYAGDRSGLFAGLTIAMVPILVVYALLQGRIQAGMTAGALK